MAEPHPEDVHSPVEGLLHPDSDIFQESEEFVQLAHALPLFIAALDALAPAARLYWKRLIAYEVSRAEFADVLDMWGEKEVKSKRLFGHFLRFLGRAIRGSSKVRMAFALQQADLFADAMVEYAKVAGAASTYSLNAYHCEYKIYEKRLRQCSVALAKTYLPEVKHEKQLAALVSVQVSRRRVERKYHIAYAAMSDMFLLKEFDLLERLRCMVMNDMFADGQLATYLQQTEPFSKDVRKYIAEAREHFQGAQEQREVDSRMLLVAVVRSKGKTTQAPV